MARKKQGITICKYPGCNYKIYWKSKLKRHIKSVHENKKDFNCEVCDRSFRCNFSLKRHSLTHKKNKGSDRKKATFQQNTGIQQCSKSIQNGSPQETKPVMIHFMRKEARANMISQESFAADEEILPIPIDFEVQNSAETFIPKKQDKHLQPKVLLRKLKNEDIELYTKKESFQPTIILTKLKEKNSEKDSSIDKQYLVQCKKNHQKFVKKSGQRNRLEQNVQEISGKKANKITESKKKFESQYNHDYWSHQKTLSKAKKNTSKNFVKALVTITMWLTISEAAFSFLCNCNFIRNLF